MFVNGGDGMKELTARLAAVAARVRPGSRVADIGTDHALLPVWLLQSGRCPAAIASDIGEGPADAARRTVSEAGLAARIPVRVGDGLSPILPDEVDDVVIAGMGGETIAEILHAAPWVRDVRYRLVLQPMSKPERLRRFLYEGGFAIEEEVVAAEGERLYAVMVCRFTGEVRTASLGDCLIGAIPHTTEGEAYLKKQGGRISDKLSGLPKTPQNAAERAELEAAARQLNAWLSSE